LANEVSYEKMGQVVANPIMLVYLAI